MDSGEMQHKNKILVAKLKNVKSQIPKSGKKPSS